MRILAITVAMLFIFPIAAMSADGTVLSGAAEKKADKKVKEKTARGEVKVVDPAARVLIIVGKDEIAFTADDSMLREIRVNDLVIVKYTDKDGRKTVTTIKADTKHKGKKKSDKKAEDSKVPGGK